MVCILTTYYLLLTTYYLPSFEGQDVQRRVPASGVELELRTRLTTRHRHIRS